MPETRRSGLPDHDDVVLAYAMHNIGRAIVPSYQ
ncbi:hypothetical protein Y600_6456 [Burkholderia pseudomallei MSHR3709]|nr:hypothetical protein Y600_6456 [Burkholderia pseudomallei MSHR3709]